MQVPKPLALLDARLQLGLAGGKRVAKVLPAVLGVLRVGIMCCVWVSGRGGGLDFLYVVLLVPQLYFAFEVR